MPKLKQILLLFSFIFSLSLFSQTNIDSLIFYKLNSIRKSNNIEFFSFDYSLYKISAKYAFFVKEYYINLPIKNIDKNVNKIFEKTSSFYDESVVSDKGVFVDDLRRVYLFIASKNNFYSEEELSNIILSNVLSNKNNRDNLICSNYKKIGISCISETTLFYKQVVFCIISFE